MRQIVGWALSITAFLLFGSLWEQLFPNKRDRKYIRFIWGLIFVLIVLKPVASWFRADDILNDYVSVFAGIWNEQAGVIPDEGEVEQQMEQAVLDAYEERTSREIAAMAADSGYILSDIRIECERDNTSERYGQLLSIEGQAMPGSTEDINAVAAVRVSQVQIGDRVSEEAVRIEELSEQIAQKYQLESEQVSIWGEAQ